jgi:nicotinamidase-related amidase
VRQSNARVSPGPPTLNVSCWGDRCFEFDPTRTALIAVDKPGFSAFYRTDLARALHLRGTTHLVCTGVTPQCCVHSTLRDAVGRGFFCLLFNWIASGRELTNAMLGEIDD